MSTATYKPTTPHNSSIGHFGKYHNTLCLFPQILHKHCFCFLLGPLNQRNWKQCLCKIWGDKQRVLWYFPKWPIPALWRRANARNVDVSFLNLSRYKFNLYQLVWQHQIFVSLSDRNSITASLETRGNISKTSASVSSGFPNTRKLMKARGRRPSAFIVFPNDFAARVYQQLWDVAQSLTRRYMKRGISLIVLNIRIGAVLN